MPPFDEAIPGTNPTDARLFTRPADSQPPESALSLPLHVNMLLPSLVRGGAERIVADLVRTLAPLGVGGRILVLKNEPKETPIEARGTIVVRRLGSLPRRQRLARAADEILQTPSPVVYTHLVRAEDLKVLWRRGVRTIPVVHNSAPGWQDPPGAYDHPMVPFIVAVSEDVARQLAEAGRPKPVRVIRHALPRRPVEPASEDARRAARAALGVGESALLIGMVGQFKLQKAYVRAVRILHAVRARGIDAKLAILGGWTNPRGFGRKAHQAVLAAARRLGVLDRLILPGDVAEPEPWYDLFDVFLNTSVYEGLSIATLEAQRAGLPVVAFDAGGQREILRASDLLLPQETTPEEGARAVLAAARLPRILPLRTGLEETGALLWPWLQDFGPGGRARPSHDGVLFLTSNLNIGGAQRSLVNLLTRLPGLPVRLCVAGPTYCEDHLRRLQQAGIPVVAVRAEALHVRATRILALIEAQRPRTVSFWNFDARLRLILAKALAGGPVRLVDVSPGPALYHELDEHPGAQRALALDAKGYFQSLDALVAKYQGGVPYPAYGVPEARVHVVPNGVPAPANADIARHRPETRPVAFDPSLAVVAACRIVPNKLVERLIDTARELQTLLPGASLTIVGGVDPRQRAYWAELQARAGGASNLHFAGPASRPEAYLGEFAAFLMLSRNQGCPNASLEAFAAGLPVVANDDGGTAEQVVDGVTGRLLSPDPTPLEAARALAEVLLDPARRRAMGKAGRERALLHFSMTKMREGHLKILFPDGVPEALPPATSGAADGGAGLPAERIEGAA